jgi:hypothetical protein
LGTLHYTVNAYEQNLEGSITVFGENGTVKVGGAYLNEMTYLKAQGVKEVDEVEASSEVVGPNLYPGYQGSMSNHPMVYDDLVRLMHGAPTLLPLPEEGLRTVMAIEKIYNAIHVE